MVIVSFLISLAGATMLLLFAVRMVRTGIERSFGASFQRLLTQSGSLLGSGMTGVMLAVVMQSSAAVALLATGFAASGYLGFPVGLSIVLGGDLGSALIIQVLTFRLDWLIPVLLAIGGWLFVKSDNKRWRQAGRILMGVAFILISLQFLRDAMEPIRDSAFLPAISDYLARDYITAFIVGAALAFVMHSSVAAILVCVTLVHIGAIPFEAAISLVLGANLGSAFIPMWLTRGMSQTARRIPAANMLLRGSWALVVLLTVHLFLPDSFLRVAGPGQSLVFAHIAFNLSLMLLVLPFCTRLEGAMATLMPGHEDPPPNGVGEDSPSALDDSVRGNPELAIASMKRELLRMIERIERMFREFPDVYERADDDKIRDLRARDEVVNRMLSNFRRYVASVPADKYPKQKLKVIRGLMDYAIRLETAGDVISKKLTNIAREKRDIHTGLSQEGWQELLHMYEAIGANLKLASNVLVSDDLESARLLVMEKSEFKRAERKSRKRHLARLQDGRAESFETSDIHLETLRALRDINSHISAIAYPILYRNGQLLETRLIQEMDSDEIQG